MGEEELVLIDDPRLKPLTDGDPLFGWDGDERLALYMSRRRGVWELYRLEHDNVYRLVTKRKAIGVRIEDFVPSLILHLVKHDTRRGYDPKVEIDKRNAALDEAARKAMADRVNNELAPKMRWAMERDGVLNHVSAADKADMIQFNERLEAEEQAEEN